MLASPIPEGWKPTPGQWAIEQKYDGHRLLVQITHLKDGIPVVQAWSRNGLTRDLPAHLNAALALLPVGIYDGELVVPGKRSYGVTELANGGDLVYTVFDILSVLFKDVTKEPYDARRAYLTTIFGHKLFAGETAVVLAPSWNVDTLDQIRTACQTVWDADGEGLIVKRRKGIYVAGKRSKDFLKMKDLRSAVLTVVGFQAGKGTIVDRGPYATVMLRDDAGIETTVKTLNDMELAAFERQAKKAGAHPAIGRRLRIEYQEKTTDGNYRHPRWDRWEDQ
jgi:bifunctional non-homologous end joining protein LigD